MEEETSSWWTCLWAETGSVKSESMQAMWHRAHMTTARPCHAFQTWVGLRRKNNGDVSLLMEELTENYNGKAVLQAPPPRHLDGWFVHKASTATLTHSVAFSHTGQGAASLSSEQADHKNGLLTGGSGVINAPWAQCMLTQWRPFLYNVPFCKAALCLFAKGIELCTCCW